MDGSTVIKVERFLGRPGTHVPLDDDGFLSDSVEGSSATTASVSGIRTWKALEHEPCVVLLGEPGSGKTRVIEEARARLAAPITTRKVDLGLFNDGEHLEKGLAFTDWLKTVGTGDLYAFLDGLDECLVQVDNAARILLKCLEDIFPQDRKRLKLRIVCRTGAWSSALASKLLELFPSTKTNAARPDQISSSEEGDEGERSVTDSQLPIWELLPLRTSDAITLATERARKWGKTLDSEKFLTAVKDASVGPLAARPKTLLYVVDLFVQHQALRGNRWELYERALRHGCTEEAEFRAEKMPREAWSPDERFLLMARVASGLLLGNCLALHRTESSSVLKGHLRVEDLGENGTIPIGARQATPAEVRRVLREEPHPLQTLEGELIRFSHRTEEEFLAAFHLVSQTTDIEKLWTVLCAGSDAIRPQFAELAGWVAAQNVSLRERIIRTSPEVLLLGGSSTLTDMERADLTERLLQACASRKIADVVGGWDNALDRLSHPDLPQKILPWLASGQDFVARRVAIRIARFCHPERGHWNSRLPRINPTQPFSEGNAAYVLAENPAWVSVVQRLIEIVLDTKEDLPLREKAAWALEEVGSASHWRCLRPLIHDTAGDINWNLRGIALRALLWRRVISLEEVFAAVRHRPRSGYLGAYRDFVYQEIPHWLERSVLPSALRWLREVWVAETSGHTESIEGAVLQVAWQYADDEHVQKELVATLLSFFLHCLSVPLNKSTVDAVPSHRRAIAGRLIREAKNKKGTRILIGRALRAAAELIRPEDLHWLLSWHRDETNAEVRPGIRNAVNALFPLTLLEHTEALIIACDQDPELKLSFRGILEPWNLDDPEVVLIRQDALSMAERQKSPIDSESEIQACLVACTTEPAHFESLLFALAQPVNGEGREINPYFSPLNELPGWQKADEARRRAIREVAANFLSSVPPEVDKWFGKSECSSDVLTGTRALMLLSECLEKLDNIPFPALEEWAVAMLTYGLDAQPQEWLVPILSALARRFPQAISDTTTQLLKLSSDPHNAVGLLRNSPLFWCDPLATQIRTWLRECSLTDKQDDAALSALIRTDAKEAAHLCWDRLEKAMSPIPEGMLPYTANAAVALWQTIETQDFKRWWGLTSRAERLSRKTVEEIAHRQFWGRESHDIINGLSSQDAEAWIRWLISAYPHRTEVQFQARLWRPRLPWDDVASLRNALIEMLARRATPEDVEILEHLDQESPDLNLRWLVARAHMARRSHGWAGWHLNELWALLRPPSAPTAVSPQGFDAKRMRECMRSAAIKGVYLLGCFDKRVTLYAQQCRALNLVHALVEHEELRAGVRVAVIGGGVGGLTAAAAVRLTGASVTLYEKEKQLLPIQRAAHHRWVHPHIYEALEWPTTDVSDLPVLPWKAGPASDVVMQLEAAFEKLASTMGSIHIHRNTLINKISKGTSGSVLLMDKNHVQTQYDIVIVAVGFGQESSSADITNARSSFCKSPISYWASDELTEQVDGKRILISGSGDGALIDLARALVADFRHAEFVEDLLRNSLYQPLRRQFMEIEDRLRMKTDVCLWSEYSKRIQVPQEVFEFLRTREDANVTFNFSHYGFFDRGTALHNRLLAFLFLSAQRGGNSLVNRWPGRIIKVDASDKAQRVFVDPRAKPHESAETFIDHAPLVLEGREFDIVVLRHGPAANYFEKNLPNLQADVDRQRKVLAELDYSRHLVPSTQDYFRRCSLLLPGCKASQ
ncbi:NACHT domain-containing protein [Stigmatella hybrida]|uniref:NACHT domain-containing protein n=1 Tax=Stigmatella hybrida TaxID=394097 RepID=UPI001CDB0428|nr:FAD-dependent oxidoreductase [Stigmatella hybrida]